MLPFFNNMLLDLEAVEKITKKEYKLKTGSITDLVSLQLENVDYQLRPALVLAAARAYGCGGEKVRRVASVIQFIYLATKVHAIVHDQEDANPADFQFPVLVGDYLYGHFFLGLSRADCLEFLAPFSQVIIDIHEAGIRRKQLETLDDKSLLDILEKEEALLCATACKAGAQLGGASIREQELFWQFGRSIGLGSAAFSHGLGKQWVIKEFKQAREALASLPIPVPSLGEFRSYLETHMTKA